jgi:acetyltransferase-like isoleucine patch superfamily enzyme
VGALKLADRASAAKVIRRKLDNNRHRSPRDLTARGLSFLAATARSRYLLREASTLGVGVRILGRTPVVYNRGVLSLGHDVKLEAPTRAILLNVYPRGELIIGDEVCINDGARFECTSSIRIGDRARIGFGVVIIDNNLHDAYNRRALPAGKPVIIEDEVWVGGNAMILPGVTIGKGSIVAAGAILVRDVPAFSVVAGNPARIVRSLDPDRIGRPDPAEPGFDGR